MNLKNVVVSRSCGPVHDRTCLPESRAQNGSETKKGSREKIKVHGKSLRRESGGGLLGSRRFGLSSSELRYDPQWALPGCLLPSRLRRPRRELLEHVVGLPQPLTPRSRTDRRVK